MVLRFFLLGIAFLFVSCTDVERDDPDDPKSKYYRGNVSFSSSSAEVPLSSVTVPSSSSVAEVPLSSYVPSSSSVSVAPSSSSVPTQTGVIHGTPVDYEGETYETVEIGTQTWMARNLNYAVEGSKCGGDDGELRNENTSYCTTYGRLFNWATAMALPDSCNTSSCASQVGTRHKGICPSGWHIPSDDEWTTLIDFVGGSSTAGRKLKATSGWNSYSDVRSGSDIYGFSALPGGLGYSDGRFINVGDYGDWWTASENSSAAYNRFMTYSSENDYRSSLAKSYLLSVRCLQD